MMADNRLRIALVSAGASESSSTTRLIMEIGAAVRELLQDDGAEVEVALVNLRDVARDLGVAVATGMQSEELRSMLATVARADGVIAGTPVYKAGPSGLFKSFWDVADDDVVLAAPVVLAATAGTPRHALVPDSEMRPLFAYMRALPVPTSVFAATEDFAAPGVLNKRVQRAAGELATLVKMGVKRELRGQEDADYRRSFATEQDGAAALEDGLNFDSDLMRLAAGGVI